MKRLHVHVSVADLDQSIRFYSTLFAATPSVTKPDYAKWMLDDPRVNFAISTHSGKAGGLDHLGIQVETQDELQEVYGRLQQADRRVLEEGAITCCYAQSERRGELVDLLEQPQRGAFNKEQGEAVSDAAGKRIGATS